MPACLARLYEKYTDNNLYFEETSHCTLPQNFPQVIHSYCFSFTILPKTPGFKKCDNWCYLKYTYHTYKTPEETKEIFKQCGVWYSVSNTLPWLINFMHCDMLYILKIYQVDNLPWQSHIKHVNQSILYNYRMYNGLNSTSVVAIEKLEGFFGSMVWPSSVDCLPLSVYINYHIYFCILEPGLLF